MEYMIWLSFLVDKLEENALQKTIMLFGHYGKRRMKLFTRNLSKAIPMLETLLKLFGPGGSVNSRIRMSRGTHYYSCRKMAKDSKIGTGDRQHGAVTT
ncbi:hypothetical protein VNO77_01832 [Canavalia gladiata]|uniref:Uncharacterized protein n=1 Tax=Canavalia gladiata TaxID=3824 RepID=A0AAN9R5C3_CANGL